MVIAVFINYDLTVLEVWWAFSIYLEAVAMVPQFVFVSKARYVHKHVLYYIISLVSYKGLYIIHWIYHFCQESHYDKVSVASGIIQFVLYIDFLVRIVPHLAPVNDENKQQQVATIGADFARLEGQLPEKCGYLNENMSTVVLDPTFLQSKDNAKVINNRLTTPWFSSIWMQIGKFTILIFIKLIVSTFPDKLTQG